LGVSIIIRRKGDIRKKVATKCLRHHPGQAYPWEDKGEQVGTHDFTLMGKEEEIEKLRLYHERGRATRARKKSRRVHYSGKTHEWLGPHLHRQTKPKRHTNRHGGIGWAEGQKKKHFHKGEKKGVNEGLRGFEVEVLDLGSGHGALGS